MRVELSNHPGEMLGDAARRRRTAEQRELSVYEDELIKYRARVQTFRVRRDRTRAGRRWWTWLRLSLAVWREKRGIPRPPAPAAGHPTDLEAWPNAASQPGSAGWSSSLTGGPGSARCGTRPWRPSPRPVTCWP